MLTVVSVNRGNAIIFRCSGRIVAGEKARALYNNVIFRPGKHVVVLDLTRVSRIDAAGLGVLASLRQWAFIAGIRLQLIPSQAVQEVLDLMGLRSHFEIRRSVSALNVPADPLEDRAIEGRG